MDGGGWGQLNVKEINVWSKLKITIEYGKELETAAPLNHSGMSSERNTFLIKLVEDICINR